MNKAYIIKPVIINLIWVGIISFIVRVTTMLALFTFYNQTWSISWLYFIPVIEFNAATDLYITLNAYSLIASSILTFIIFLVFAYRYLNTTNKKVIVCALYIAMLLPFLQYVIMVLSSTANIQSRNILNTSGFFTLAIAILASIITLIRINKKYRVGI